MWSGTAWDWVVVVALYGVGLATWAFLGGFATASRAFRGWGRATSIRRARRLGIKLPASLR